MHGGFPVESVTLFPDYSAESPLFASGIMVHREEMPGLGLTEDLADRLVAWQALFDRNYAIDGIGWTDGDARDEWFSSTGALVDELRRQLAAQGVALETNLWQRPSPPG